MQIKKINSKLQYFFKKCRIIFLIEKTENQPSIEKDNLKDNLLIKIKNIGRCPAIKVIVTESKLEQEKALFEKTQPHAIDLFSTEKKDNWKLDIDNLTKLIKNQTKCSSIEELIKIQKPIYFYIHYSDQLMKNKYTVKTKLIAVDGNIIYGGHKYFLKVMENKRM